MVGEDKLKEQKQGKFRTKIYTCWVNMVQRCSNPLNPAYKSYGGRGIKICQEWLRFENFYDDMGEPPLSDSSIERIDVNGDYEKDNCKWISLKQQGKNTRRIRMLTFQGKTQSVADWCRELKINSRRLYTRLELGWTVEEAIKTPVRVKIEKSKKVRIMAVQRKMKAFSFRLDEASGKQLRKQEEYTRWVQQTVRKNLGRCPVCGGKTSVSEPKVKVEVSKET